MAWLPRPPAEGVISLTGWNAKMLAARLLLLHGAQRKFIKFSNTGSPSSHNTHMFGSGKPRWKVLYYMQMVLVEAKKKRTLTKWEKVKWATSWGSRFSHYFVDHFGHV
jgi:hypothetical protein